MDEKALGALMLIDPTPQAQEEPDDLQMPEAPQMTPAPTQAPASTPAPSVYEKETPVFSPISASEAVLLTEETVSLSNSAEQAFVSPDCSDIVVQYASGYFHVHLSENSKIKVTAITLVEQGASFRIQNAFSLPALFELGSGTTSVTIKAEIKGEKGKTSEISLGTYSLLP